MKISILAWAVRHALQRDFTGTLAALVEQGYQGIHFLGDFGGFAPAELSAIMNDIGLETCAIHCGPEGLLEEHNPAYDYARELDCTFVTTSLSKADFSARHREYAETCNRIDAIARDRGLTFAYHNHGVEFTEVDGVTAYDLFCARLGKNVALNANVLWAQMGSVDPIQFLTTFLDRSPIVHVGDCNAAGEFCDLGTGVAPLPEIMAMLEGRVQWAVLDHDNEANDELPSAERCIRCLRKLVRARSS
ncbi:MAG: sugar phosphate isomerase/epimerase [Lentisphaerae bacterium]|jgi:sugar phosphate isomerase/epimerase|nr:sugar phosphate isomerase/epimerase [Lentisphaerota bacterium]MBT4817895.1 sugar phosphate isomerase/epimerase [Lentisphaerota bacterium]MBT5605395.1 sugar phosphate isomerase/epimerase [Lentisphaerota bacterium]MBT7062019.1 sugar phosphate isomerase/epimerase [Lentisphaerota bacterium]MBT7848611.1 sugar phosphate isomerase/epimerase [Lentisphaerota bacterium]